MQRKAKLFLNGKSQAVRLPADFRFTGKQVFIRKDPATGDVILSARPESWKGFLALPPVPADFLEPRIDPPAERRDPLA
jgi:antitoxin VapB